MDEISATIYINYSLQITLHDISLCIYVHKPIETCQVVCIVTSSLCRPTSVSVHNVQLIKYLPLLLPREYSYTAIKMETGSGQPCHPSHGSIRTYPNYKIIHAHFESIESLNFLFIDIKPEYYCDNS